jgi:exodeoxyribonuclease-5
MAEIVLTDEQQAVFAAAERFIRNPRPAKPYFYFEGLAGTGKSVVLAALARAHPRAALCAFTGKAASVLTRKSGLAAGTIHQAIYQFLGEDKETGNPYFKPKHDDGDLDGDLAFIDESSMISVRIMDDFLATGCRIVASGDPGQLPAVRAASFFNSGMAAARLVTVHRQAWDSAIIRQAYNVRHNGFYVDDGADFRVVNWFSETEAISAGAILCWRNATRRHLNGLVRQWKGLPPWQAMAGEPVMCLKNDHDLGVLNGAVYELLEDHAQGSGVIVVRNERGEDVEIEKAWIEDYEPMPLTNDTKPFAWGYCATVHKYQGSESETGILIDEYGSQDGAREWRYTGISRFSKSLIVQRNW